MKAGLIALILLLPALAAAKHETGNDLLGNCSLALKLYNHENVSGDDFIKIGDCTGVVSGVMQTAALRNASSDNGQSREPATHFCAPPDVSVEQVVRMVVKRLQSNPGELNLDAALIVLRALNEGFSTTACMGDSGKQAPGLQWPDPPKKSPLRVRLVAIALADRPRSSFFSSQEVFVAEMENSDEEWRLIKLVFTFLPYQPRLSESGFDYSVVHKILASRNADCDQTVPQLTARSLPDRHEPLIYSHSAPREDLDRRNIPLPCYETKADDYIKSSLEPLAPPPEPPRPTLQARPDPR